MRRLAALMCVLAVSWLVPAQADQVLWVELTQGDLSNDRFSPSAFALTPGDNELFGIISGDNGQGSFDRDYFSITIPAGFQLAQLVLDLYISADFAAFIGIQPGPIFPDDPDTVQPEDLMGWTLFGASQTAEDLLPVMGSNGSGFTPPLPSGTYTFWAQQMDDFTEWNSTFVVTEVPEPAPAIGLLLAGLAHATRRRAGG